MSHGVGHRYGSDLPLLRLWLWLWPAAAALIQPPPWELPYDKGVALKNKTKKQKKKTPQMQEDERTPSRINAKKL